MTKPEMTFVESSNVESIGYDQENRIVYIQYINGSLYIYKDVPEIEYEGLLHAPSIGSYLHRNFKNVYPYERMS